MIRSHVLLSLLCLSGVPLWGDTIYQASAEGKEVVVQRDAILIREDSSSIVYKHFDLKERRVVKVRLNKGSLPYSVETSSAEEREQTVENWKKFGYLAVITDRDGKTARIFDFYLDFYPPGGRGSLLDSVPPRTALPVELDRGGADEIVFSDIEHIEFQGDRLKLARRNGQVDEGRFLMPTDRPAEARFLGITEHYAPASDEVFYFSLPLDRVKEIRFEQ
jgi:hypothetical protein